LVYGKLDKFGKPYLMLSSLSTDSGIYVHRTQPNYKNLKGGVGFRQLEPFGDVPVIDTENLAKRVSRELEIRGVTREWGVCSLNDLRKTGKCEDCTIANIWLFNMPVSVQYNPACNHNFRRNYHDQSVQ
jgi:hypothetical protein